jgi:hypothetical protein
MYRLVDVSDLIGVYGETEKVIYFIPFQSSVTYGKHLFTFYSIFRACDFRYRSRDGVN